MIVRRRFSLDTNILVYASDRSAGDRHEQSKNLVAHAAKCDCVLTLQALAEFYHATTRKNLLQASVARAFVHDWLAVFQITSADASAFVDAIEAVQEHKIAFWDAMLWAAARRSGCSAVISEDMQDGRLLGGVEFINPFSDNAQDRLATFLSAS